MRVYSGILQMLLLATLASCTQIGTSIVESYMEPYGIAQSRAQMADVTRGDIKGAIRHWKESIPHYSDGSWPLTLASIYQNIGNLMLKSDSVGEVPEIAKKLKNQMEQIDRTGIDNIDDKGDGYRVSQVVQMGTPQNIAILHKKSYYSNLLTSSDFLMSRYYEKVGNTAKAQQSIDRVTAQSKKREAITKELKPIIDSYQRPETQQHVKEQESKWAKSNRLQAKLLSDAAAGKDFTQTIDEIVEFSKQEPLDKLKNLEDGSVQSSKSLIAAFKKQNLPTAQYEKQIRQDKATFQRIRAYYKKHILHPWGLGVKASILYQLGRYDSAMANLEQASSLYSSAPEYPVKDKRYASYWNMLSDKDLITWDILRALIYNKQQDMRAVGVWQKVIEELMAREKNRSIKNHTFNTVYAEEIIPLVAAESVKAFKMFQKEDEGIRFIESLVDNLDRVRTSISSEQDKQGYLAKGLSFYDSFIELTINSAEKNLHGMERAKSRTMLDIMSGGIQNVQFQEVRKLQQTAYSQTNSQTDSLRAISFKRLDSRLDDLKAGYPEYYTLATTEVEDQDKLISLLDPKTVALSYYVAPDNLYINVLGVEEGAMASLLTKPVERVVKVPVPKATLAGLVHQHRQALFNTPLSSPAEDPSIGLRYSADDRSVTLEIVNTSFLPVKVEGVVNNYGTFNTLTLSVPSIPLPGGYRSNQTTELSIVPGNSVATVFSHQTDGNNSTHRGYEPPAYSKSTFIVETSLGELSLEVATTHSSGTMKTETVAEKKIPVIIGEKSLHDVLIRPVQELIQGKRLVIVPHGVLHSLPFETLVNEDGQYLNDEHIVSYVPSLNVLKLAREKKRDKPSTLRAYGDTLGDLKFARTEVETIKGMFEQAEVFLGAEVTEATVTSSIGDGDVIHFANHGVFNPASPLHSGLVMYSPEGVKGVQHEGFNGAAVELLDVIDIMNMTIQPNLVFLSACDTGKAEISSGDEIVGLTRGFLVAGAPSLVNTLWAIDDKSTSILVERFYENILAKGMDKARALQEAKQHVMRNGYREPYFWGAFVLQGDWR